VPLSLSTYTGLSTDRFSLLIAPYLTIKE